MLTDVSLFLRNVLLPVSHLVLLGWVLLLLNPPSNPALRCLVSFYTVVFACGTEQVGVGYRSGSWRGNLTTLMKRDSPPSDLGKREIQVLHPESTIHLEVSVHA